MNKVKALAAGIPLLGILDVSIALSAQFFGYSLEKVEKGLFASFFIKIGLLPLYIPIYLGFLTLISLLIIHLHKTNMQELTINKISRALAVMGLCVTYAILTSIVIMNVLVLLCYEQIITKYLIIRMVIAVTSAITLMAILRDEI